MSCAPQHAPDDASRVTYAAKLAKSESRADFTLAAQALVDRIRAFDPWPGCTAELHVRSARHRCRTAIWKARSAPGDAGGCHRRGRRAGHGCSASTAAASSSATGNDPVVLTELQKPGGKRLPASLFARDFGGPAGRFVAPGLTAPATGRGGRRAICRNARCHCIRSVTPAQASDIPKRMRSPA